MADGAQRTLPPDLLARLRGGLAWSFVAAAATAGATFVSGVVVASCVGREAFGRFSMLRSTLVALATLAPFAMGLTATKFTAELRDGDRERLARILALCARVTRAGAAAAAGGLALLAGPVARGVLRAPDLEAPLRWVGVAAGGVVLASLPLGVLAGLEAFRALAATALAAGAITVAAVGLGARLAGVSGAALGLAAAGAAQAALAHAAGARELRRLGIPRGTVGPGERGILGDFALPAALGGVSMMGAQWVASAALARAPGGYGELGLFGAANTVRSLVVFVPGLVLAVAVAVLNQQRTAGDAEHYHRVYRAHLAATAGVATAVACGVAAFGPWILRRFGPRFDEGAGALAVLALAAVLECVAVAAYQLVQAEGRMWRVFFAVVLPRDALLVGLALVLAPARGALGVAIAYAAAHAVALTGAAVATVLLARSGRGGPAHGHASLATPLDALEP